MEIYVNELSISALFDVCSLSKEKKTDPQYWSHSRNQNPVGQMLHRLIVCKRKKKRKKKHHQFASLLLWWDEQCPRCVKIIV